MSDACWRVCVCVCFLLRGFGCPVFVWCEWCVVFLPVNTFVYICVCFCVSVRCAVDSCFPSFLANVRETSCNATAIRKKKIGEEKKESKREREEDEDVFESCCAPNLVFVLSHITRKTPSKKKKANHKAAQITEK